MPDVLNIAYFFFAEHPGTIAFIVCLSYLALLISARRRMVFAPDEQQLLSQATKLLADIDARADKTKQLPEIKSARTLIVETIKRFQQWRPGRFERWFTSGAHVLGYWDDLHEAKRLMIAALNLEELNVRLRAAAVELRHVKNDWADEAVALAGDIEAFIGENNVPLAATYGNGDAHAAAASDRPRALLARALRVLYSVEDSTNQTTTNWHNKSLWISMSSLLFIVVLAAIFGHPRFLLMGALGGFLSKLVKLRSSKDVPADYDSYWATFFFTGPLGALIGWTGLMLLYALNRANLLGTLFVGVVWPDGLTPGVAKPGVADAAAFLLGFSATLFDRLITRTEAQPASTGQPASTPLPTKSAPATP